MPGSIRPFFITWLLAAATLNGAAGADNRLSPQHYQVRFPAGLDLLEVSHCVPVAAHASRGEHCRQFRTDLRRHSEGRVRRNFQISSAVRLVELTDLDWLPRPGDTPEGTVLTFHTPPGIAVSAPWPPLRSDAAQTSYQLPHNGGAWDGRIAFGKMRRFTLHAGSAAVRVAILDSNPAIHEAEMLRWLQQGLNAITSVYGRFPLESTQLLVTPIGKSRGEVPWGQVMRGGHPAIHLFVDQTDPYQQLLDDWTMFHEISHLYIPLVDRSDFWLSEGLASYYQTLTRARYGLIEEHTAWQKLLRGMQNGIEQADERRPFSEVLAAPGWSSIRLVYWTGAAIFMKADIELRASSDNRQSLDWVLDEFQHCCLPSSRLWSAAELLAKFDAIAGRPVFTPIARKYLKRTGFPDIDQDLLALGINSSVDGTVSIDRSAPLAKVAAGIMAVGSPTP